MAKYWVGVNWDRVGAVCVEAVDEEEAVRVVEGIASGPYASELAQVQAFVEEGSEWIVDEERVWEARS